MMRRLLCAGIILLTLAACGKNESPAQSMLARAPATDGARAKVAVKAGAEERPEVTAPAPQTALRHIELHHTLAIEVSADKLQAVWQAQVDACRPPYCEVVSANIESRRGDISSGELSLRIVPAQADRLLETLQALGRLTQHQMTQTDRTNEVVDYQARLNNQKALRDRLRALLAGRVDKVADLLEVERELARVQGEIDSLEGQIRATLAVTEKINFDIRFYIPTSMTQPSSWEPVREAWGRIGQTFAGSLAALMYFLAGGLPWFVVLALVIWGTRRLWRWRKRRSVQA
jgi:hypothetical protein